MTDNAYEIRIKEVTPQRFVSVRTLTSPEALGGVMQSSLEVVWKYLNQFEEVHVGPAIARYLRIDDDILKVEVGFPVAEEIDGFERIQVEMLPGGKAATTLHYGDYAALPDAHAAVHEWIAKSEHVVGGPAYEIFWVEPGASEEAKPRTEIVVPIRA